MVLIKRFLIISLGIILAIFAFPPQAFAASSVIADSHSSSVLNRTMNFNVYLPPSYASNPSKEFPVMYLLHGMYGSNTDWTSMGMQSIVDNSGGKELVIIMPNGFNSFYLNGYQSGINYEDYLHNELIPFVESKYRIDAANGKSRAIAGLSMGGYGATYHGFKYPDKFSSVYSMSGALIIPGAADISTVINKNEYPAYVMECGTEDSMVYQLNVTFHQKLQSLGISHDYITRSGTHSVDFWKACLPKAILFASEHFTTEPAIVPGDIDNDGQVTAIDAGLLRKHLLGTDTLSGEALKAADVNKDGAVDALDLSLILKQLLQLL